jgi:hypothetical protein
MSAGRKMCLIAGAVLAAGLLYLFGCDEDALVGVGTRNVPPSVRLTSGPPEGDTTSYQIKFSWIGNDPDGRVDHYEYAICDGNPFGFDPADTTGPDKWRKTFRTDSLFRFTTNAYDRKISDVYGWYQQLHTFFVRAVDNAGARSQAVYRSFTARNISPFVTIESPRNPFPNQVQILPPVVKFSWTGHDPTDTPWQTQDVDSVRYLVMKYRNDVYDSMSKNIAAFEKLWCPWRAYDAVGDSGRSTTIGDDELMEVGMPYMFAVQAKDEAGAVTPLFSKLYNVRLFYVFNSTGPVLLVKEPYLGAYQFLGMTTPPMSVSIPVGFGLNFQWSANAATYGGEVSSYRYGWDLIDLNNPDEWAVPPGPDVMSAPELHFNAGIHTLFIEATDNVGGTTIGQVEITVFPLDMTRNLLWIDDLYSTDFPQQNNGFPTESQHTQFWTDVLQRAEGFDPSRDIFRTVDNWYLPPPTSVLWKYKNVVWTYSACDEINAWDDLVRFVPESRVGKGKKGFNYLAYYVALGGHVWTEGMGDREGGLGAVLDGNAKVFPTNLRCEITGPSRGCAGDTSGVFSTAYRDYCVTVLDKVQAAMRIDDRLPTRRVDRDAMSYAIRDDRDPVTAVHDKLPRTLVLWDEVTRQGMFFDPDVRGFTYVEVYNPGYWMTTVKASQQSCFHPMYRMRSRSDYSVMNYTCVAFWATKYANVVAGVPGAVAAPSVQFGFPLWFFNRAQVDSIADVIFGEWSIRKLQ